MLAGPDNTPIRPSVLPAVSPPPPPPAPAAAPAAATPAASTPAAAATPQPTTFSGLLAQQRNAVLGGAAAYGAAGPGVTVHDAVVAAVAPVILAAERDQDAAQRHLSADRSNEQSTQSVLNALYANIDSRGVHGSALAHAATLQHELTQQQGQVAADQRQVGAAKAKVSTTTAAGNIVIYGEQAKGDQTAAAAAARKMKKSYARLTEILPKNLPFKAGGQPLTQVQIDSLNSSQRQAYFNYLTTTAEASSAQAKVYADNAEINQSYAQLQVYLSDKKSSPAMAADAAGSISAVNNALAPLHLRIATPAAIDPRTAQSNLSAADNSKALADAYLNYTKAAIPALAAANNVAAAQANVDTLNNEIKAFQQKANACVGPDSTLMAQLSAANKALAQAKAAAVLPQAALSVASTYMGKVQAAVGLQQAESASQNALTALGKAKAAYAKWRAENPALDAPGNKYEMAVNQAEQQVAQTTQLVTQARQQASTAAAQFNAAYAQLYASQLDVKVSQAWQNVTSATSCTANPADSPYAIWKADQQAAQAAHDVANSLTAAAGKQAADYQVTVADSIVTAEQQRVKALQTSYDQWSQAHPGTGTGGGSRQSGAAGGANPFAPALLQAQAGLSWAQQNLMAAQQQAQAAQYQVELAAFMASQPFNMQDPQNAQDRQAQQQAEYQFYVKHEFQSGPINGQDAINQVKADLSNEHQYLASRGLLEHAWDWFTGGNHSAVETYLDNELTKLQAVQKEQTSGQLTGVQYQNDLHNILDTYGQTYLTLSSQEQAGDKHWQMADEVFRGAAATVVGVVATAASGGNVAVGFMAGFATYQAIDGAENVITVAQGGNIMNDPNISLGGLIGEAVTGHASMGMFERAGVTTAEDAVSSLAIPVGGAVAGKVSSLVVTKALGTLADTAAADGLGTAATEAVNVPLGTGLKAGVLGNLANQGVMSTSQLVNTAITAQANGGLFTARGGDAMLSAAEDQAFYIGTAPFVGAMGHVLPAGTVTNFATNAALSFGDTALVGHHGMTADDWIAAGINAGVNAAAPGAGEGDMQAQPEQSPEVPSPVLRGEGTPPSGDQTPLNPSLPLDASYLPATAADSAGSKPPGSPPPAPPVGPWSPDPERPDLLTIARTSLSQIKAYFGEDLPGEAQGLQIDKIQILNERTFQKKYDTRDAVRLGVAIEQTRGGKLRIAVRQGVESDQAVTLALLNFLAHPTFKDAVQNATAGFLPKSGFSPNDGIEEHLASLIVPGYSPNSAAAELGRQMFEAIGENMFPGAGYRAFFSGEGAPLPMAVIFPDLAAQSMAQFKLPDTPESRQLLAAERAGLLWGAMAQDAASGDGASNEAFLNRFKMLPGVQYRPSYWPSANDSVPADVPVPDSPWLTEDIRKNPGSGEAAGKNPIPDAAPQVVVLSGETYGQRSARGGDYLWLGVHIDVPSSGNLQKAHVYVWDGAVNGSFDPAEPLASIGEALTRAEVNRNMSPALGEAIKIPERFIWGGFGLDVSRGIVEYLASRGLPGDTAASPGATLAREIFESMGGNAAITENEALDAIFSGDKQKLSTFAKWAVPAMARFNVEEILGYAIPAEALRQRIDPSELIAAADIGHHPMLPRSKPVGDWLTSGDLPIRNERYVEALTYAALARYASGSFLDTAERYQVNIPRNKTVWTRQGWSGVSNLAEGAIKYFGSKILYPTPFTNMLVREDNDPDTDMAWTIFSRMGENDVRAVFAGDPAAIATFDRLAQEMYGPPETK